MICFKANIRVQVLMNIEIMRRWERYGIFNHASIILKLHFDMYRFMKLTGKRFLNFFFLFEPSLAPERYTTAKLLLDQISHALSGLSILIYLLVGYRKIRGPDYLILLYIGAYAFPYMFAGIMSRYSFPICSLTTILLGKSIHVMYEARHSLQCARRVT